MGNKGFLKFLSVALATSILAACGGGGAEFGGSTGSTTGGTTGTTTTPTANAAHLSVVTSTPSIGGGATSATITVTVTDADNLALAGVTVKLKANKGTLVVPSTTTDSNGNVAATLTQGGASSGDTITVTATVGSLPAKTVNVGVTSPSTYTLGSFASDGVTFTAEAIKIGVGSATMAAGGTSALTLVIVDTANGNALYQGNATVTFTSPCTTAGKSQITSPVSITTGGVVNSSYVAQGCSTGTDKITATTVIGGNTLTATGTINIATPTLGGLKFVSASPSVIGIAGTGQNTASKVTFEVTDSTGQPLGGVLVNFSLAATTGGITLENISATSGADGLVQTIVNSGTVHTTVVVNATISGTSKLSQSIGPVISLAIPTQNAFSLSATKLNMEAAATDGVTSTITARLSDRYGNAVPDGTAINFTAECGHVDASCSTINSACSVVFTSQAPRTGFLYDTQGNMNAQANADRYALGNDDHRCSVMAATAGEESFNDANGNGLYDTGEFFVARPEAFLDANENGAFNKGNITTPSNDTFLDFNLDTVWNSPVSPQFVGLLCNIGSNASPVPGACSGGGSLNVFQNIPIVLASGNARLSPAQSNATDNAAVADDPLGFADVTFDSVKGKTISISVLATDVVGQVLPAGTVVTISSTLGTVSGPASYTVPNTSINTVVTAASGITYPASILNFNTFVFKLSVPTALPLADGTVTISATSPGGITTFTTFDITLP